MNRIFKLSTASFAVAAFIAVSSMPTTSNAQSIRIGSVRYGNGLGNYGIQRSYYGNQVRGRTGISIGLAPSYNRYGYGGYGYGNQYGRGLNVNVYRAPRYLNHGNYLNYYRPSYPTYGNQFGYNPRHSQAHRNRNGHGNHGRTNGNSNRNRGQGNRHRGR